MFSVVIPLYNKEKYILRAIESVLAQDFKDFELIIIDDGSTDNSLASLKDISDSRFRVVEQANQGVGAARNRGMTEASYEWIAFLDADDAWSTTHLSELLNIIKDFPDSGMVSTKILEVEDSNKAPVFDASIQSNIRIINYFYEAARNIAIVHSSSVAVSKKSFNYIGGFGNEKAGEDLEFWARIAYFYPVAVSDKTTVYYFRDTGGVMKTLAKDNIKNYRSLENISLYDISPSVRFLINQSKEDPKTLKDSNIRLYVNSRIMSTVKGRVFNRDFSEANSFAKLALPQLNRTYTYMFIYSLTPNLLLRNAYSCYLYMKR